MKENVKSGKNAPEQTEVHPSVEKIETNEEYNKRLTDRLNEKNGSTLVKYKELLKVAPKLALWLKELVRFGNVDSQVLIFINTNESGKNKFHCELYTNDHCYSIYGNQPTETNKGYLGCGATTRKNRVGEDWNRGNDLPDGKYNKKTFDAIVRRIVAYELKTLQLWRK